MLKINLSKQAEKFLRNIPPKHAKQIAKKLVQLRLDPKPQDVKKLINSVYLRVDSGEYRIIYLLNEKTGILEIVIIGKRNDGQVYRKLNNL